MKKIASLIAAMVMALLFGKNLLAYDNHGYPWNITTGCENYCYGDDYGFCKNNCTSYAAYVLNLYGVDFTNSYKKANWGDAKNWPNAARSAGIKVDNYPIPGDIAYWNDGEHGHDAVVEKVSYDGSGNTVGIFISEYNWLPRCRFSDRGKDEAELKVGTSDYPDGFIHILAFNEGVTGLYYLDSYETSAPGQTSEEWRRITQKVWDEYRCMSDCGSSFSKEEIAQLSDHVAGFGGGPDPGDDTPTLNGPDANVKMVEIDATGNNWHHSYLATPGQRLKVRVKVTNKGDETINYFEVFIHRSTDKDFNQRIDFSYGREEESNDLAPEAAAHKHRDIIAPTTPGIYYIFAYINRVDGERGGTDQDWDNNTSRDDDPEEYAVLIVETPAPDADFTADKNTGFAPLQVQFQDTSKWSPTSWLWNFGDGTISNQQNPAHIYTSVGTFTVTLTVSNELGETTETKQSYIITGTPPSIQITNPDSRDVWRSSYTKDIRWNFYNFPTPGNVAIYYTYDGGASWLAVTTSTENDGIKHWSMCGYKTINSKNCYVKIVSLNYPGIQAISPKFEIDHARGVQVKIEKAQQINLSHGGVKTSAINFWEERHLPPKGFFAILKPKYG